MGRFLSFVALTSLRSTSPNTMSITTRRWIQGFPRDTHLVLNNCRLDEAREPSFHACSGLSMWNR